MKAKRRDKGGKEEEKTRKRRGVLTPEVLNARRYDHFRDRKSDSSTNLSDARRNGPARHQKRSPTTRSPCTLLGFLEIGPHFDL